MTNRFDQFLRDNRLTTSTVLLVLSAVSGYFTYQGAVLVLDGARAGGFSLSALIFSTGVTAALFLFWQYALGIVPTMKSKGTRVIGLAVVGLGGLFIVALSSWMNVMALAGAGALEAHMRGSIKEHETALQQAHAKAKAVETLIGDIALAADRYDNLAQREIRSGALTGAAGAGGVSNSLLATQKGFADLAALIRREGRRFDGLRAEGQAAIAAMERALSAEGSVADLSIQERHASFTAEAARVAGIVGELDNAELAGLIARTVRGFSGGAGLFSTSLRNGRPKNGRLAAAQGDALQRIATDLADTGERIAVAAEALGEAKPVQAPAFERIGLSTAVFVYAGELVPYWAGGIGLDLMPVVLILLLMLLHHAVSGHPPTDPEIDGMSFGQVRKVILALEDMRGAATRQDAGRKQIDTQPVPAIAPAGGVKTSEPRLDADDEAEWEQHLKG